MDQAFASSTPAFSEVGASVSLPDMALLYDMERTATGSLLPRVWQQTGSCVGAAAARSYAQTQAGDAVHRGTGETIKPIFPWATYGIGRALAGMNYRGGGSFGSAQAKAVREWGMIAAEDSRVPQPKTQDGWQIWTSAIELNFSVPRSWPVAEKELAKDAANHQMAHVAEVKTIDDLMQCFAQGYGVTVASMFGTKPAIKNGLLIGEWNASWAHQMSLAGYQTHSQLGVLFAVDNQWGPDAHGRCPWLESRYAGGVRGSFWVTRSTMERILKSRDSEVFAHGNSEDFPPREIDWDSLGMGS